MSFHTCESALLVRAERNRVRESPSTVASAPAVGRLDLTKSLNAAGATPVRRLVLRALVTIAALAGCLAAAPAWARGACPCSSGEVAVDGQTRAYRVCAPEPAEEQLPVVMYLHDQDESASGACRTTGWHELGAEAGFVTVYLQGCDGADGACDGSWRHRWNDEAVDQESAVDDVAYVRAVLARVAAEHKVDPTRIYAVGLGQGANMASLLACRAADMFAAVAPVNGAAKFADCPGGTHVSVFPVNGDRDRVAPWAGCCAARTRHPQSPWYVDGCENFPPCVPGFAWSPPVLGGVHPVAVALGFGDLPGLEGIAEAVCSTDPGPFGPLACPEEIAPNQGSCYGIEDCAVGPGPVRSEVLGLRLEKGHHKWRQLDRVVDLKQYLWARLSTSRKLLAVACTNTVAEVYATPIDPSISNGTIQRCTPLPPFSKENIAAALEPGSPGLEVQTGITQYLVAYRTELVPGTPAVTTGVIALPDEPLPGPLPVIVGGHGLAGIADACAPSLVPGIKRVTHGWASVGYPSILPDYAGLGTDGVQPSFSTVSVAHSLLDGARALRSATRPGATDGRMVLVGHSQGGGGSVIAQGIVRQYAPELELAAVVAAASGYLPANPFEAARFPDEDITSGDGAERAITAAGVYSAVAAVSGEAKAAAFFREENAIRFFTVTVLQSYCGEAIPILNCTGPEIAAQCAFFGYTPPQTIGELITAAALDGVVACLDDEDECTQDNRAVVDFLDYNKTPLDEEGADILLLAGINDTIFPPESSACSVLAIEQSLGRSPQVCVSTDDHFGITAAQLAYQQQWVKAKLAGDDLPACPEALTLPPCPF